MWVWLILVELGGRWRRRISWIKTCPKEDELGEDAGREREKGAGGELGSLAPTQNPLPPTTPKRKDYIETER
jgi:hypothetical protein